MNFYKHHIGDYAQATSHLTFVEDGAYSRLIRKYYAEEQPLPAELKQVQRIVGARSREERQAVETVLREFFYLEEDGWHQSRCDAEIDAATVVQGGREVKMAGQRERQRRHRERRKELFESLRNKGEVPRYDASTEELAALMSAVTERESTGDVTPSVTRDATAIHNPDARSQTPVANKVPGRYGSPKSGAESNALPAWLPSECWASWCEFRATKSGKGWTVKAQELSLKKLEALWHHGCNPAAVIEQSIERGWSGLFPVGQVSATGNLRQDEGRRRIDEFLAECSTPSHLDDRMTIDVETLP